MKVKVELLKCRHCSQYNISIDDYRICGCGCGMYYVVKKWILNKRIFERLKNKL
jgi:hypothetical protein